MAIIAIEGGIGAGKTLSGTTMLIQDMIDGKRGYSNVNLIGLPKEVQARFTYLDKKQIVTMFERIKKGEIDLRNSTIFIQEAHNYVDSRNSATKQNKVFGYWILQSRHTGEGTCDIIYDTQDVDQVDKRLRRNTDILFHPFIVEKVEYTINGKIKDKPSKILLEGYAKVGHSDTSFNVMLDVLKTCDHYDTHQKVEF